MPEPRQATPLERHAQTLVTTVVGFLLAWVGLTVQGLSVDVAVQAEKIDGLKAKIEIGMSDRFTGTEGRALTKRVERIERAIERHEINGGAAP